MASIQTKPVVESLEEKFLRLAKTWQDSVAHLSSSTRRDNHAAYQEIIALGQPVVPFLLRDLERDHRHWFTTLTVITGSNPVPDEDAGKIAKMADAWVAWGRQKGFQW